MFKMLEKLINEHGSAKILKERLGLKDDQIESLKNEFNSLTQENERLKTENQELKERLEQTNQELNNLKESTSVGEGDRLGEVETKILNYLFENDKYHRIEEIANVIGDDNNTAKYYINNLLERKFVHDSLRVGGPTTYKIIKNGIKYIVENKNT